MHNDIDMIGKGVDGFIVIEQQRQRQCGVVVECWMKEDNAFQDSNSL